MPWVREDAEERINRIGSAVCEYFHILFQSYPLNYEGFKNSSEAAHTTMQEYVLKARSRPMDKGVLQAKDAARTAMTAEYLLRSLSSNAMGRNHKEGPDSQQESGVEDGKLGAVNHASKNASLFASESDLTDFLTRIVVSPPFSQYHRILADEGLTAARWRSFLTDIISSSERLLSTSASSASSVICIFVDELNTAGCLGMITEAFISHCLDGVPLPHNMFFVGAINPLRGSSAPPGSVDFTKPNIGVCEEDDSTDYLAMAPYIVRQLSPSMHSIKLQYPNLDKKGEEYFLREHLQMHLVVSKPTGVSARQWGEKMRRFSSDAVNTIIAAQELVRKYEVPRAYMSIRNLVRCSLLLSWLINFSVPTKGGADGTGNTSDHENIFLPPLDGHESGSESESEENVLRDTMQRSLIMAVCVTYWLQLPSHGHVLAGKAKEDLRERFLKDISRHTNRMGVEQSILNWKNTINESLKNLFSFANVPRGLAHTTALKENFYCVVLASINKIPLLITGPPGCGKTLSYSLACDALKGNSALTVAFRSLQKAKKITYQCSVTSTGPEIAAVCDGARWRQQQLDAQQPGKHICLLGLDEAGLTPENRQALKSLHDHLDMREIGTVMMSNSTLDAAKSSRAIQLLQTQVHSLLSSPTTFPPFPFAISISSDCLLCWLSLNLSSFQANMTDLWELAWGMIAAEDAEVESEHMEAMRKAQVGGLCVAFQSIESVVPKDNWFHSRDFIYLCRLLRVMAAKDKQALFDSAMLVECLRRHFQPLDPSVFPAIASHFLAKCSLERPLGDDLDARVVQSLRSSLGDGLAMGSDPTSAHCRYTLVVDPTDCEAAVDLLFALKLLDQTSAKIVSLSDFPEDASPTMTTAALAQVKKCIEDGETLLLVNSAPLQSALYDVINRHYAVSVRDDGTTDAFANIPLGSFSSLVRVHESFRLIVHVPLSQLPKTPMPFLNRFEKFTLSVRDALAQRVFDVSHAPPDSLLSIAKPEHRQKLFRVLEDGVNDFVAFAGGSSSFYGMSNTETVPALVLRALEDAFACTDGEFEPRPSIIAGLRLLEKEELVEQCDEFAQTDGTHRMYADTNTDPDYELNRHMDEQDENGLHGAYDPDCDKVKLGISFEDIDINNISSDGNGNTDGDAKDEMSKVKMSVDEMRAVDYGNRSIGIGIGQADRGYRHGLRGSASGGSRSVSAPLPTRLRALIRALNFQMMEIARVESVFRLRDRLPAVYMREFLENQEHLSVVSFLRQLLKSSPKLNATPGRTSEKLVIYTRTDGHLLRLVTDSGYADRILGFNEGEGAAPGSSSATASATSSSEDASSLQAIIVSGTDASPELSASPKVCIIPLAAFSNSRDCAQAIGACMCPCLNRGCRVLIVVADMKQVRYSTVRCCNPLNFSLIAISTERTPCQ